MGLYFGFGNVQPMIIIDYSDLSIGLNHENASVLTELL